MEMATDPFDWPANAAMMRDLDSSLRCTICHEFYNTPKLLPCGHTYCSECIRKQGDVQMRTGARLCPDCRTPWEPAHLDSRPVQSLALAVKAYQQSRSHLLDAVQRCSTAAPRPAEHVGVTSAKQLNSGAKRTRRQREDELESAPAQKQQVSTTNAVRRSNSSAKPSCSAENIRHSEAEHVPPTAALPDRAQQDPPPGCGACPICSKVISLSYLQSHVDSCLISTEANTGIRTGSARHGVSNAVHDLTDSTGDGADARCVPSASSVPPKLCFQLLKDKDARKKLQDYGLSTLGDRVDLEKRYQAFRQFVQLAHDRGDRASLKRFARRFSVEEQKRAEAISTAPVRVQGADADFDTLIAVAKQRMAEHKAQMAQHVVPSQGGIKTNAMPVDCKVQDDCDRTIVDLPLQELSPAPELRKVLPSATAADVNPHA